MMKKYLRALYLSLILIANTAATHVWANEGEKLDVYIQPQPLNETPVTDEAGQETIFGEDDSRLRVVNLWALWCVSCRKEMPTLDALSEEYDPKDIEFLTVAVGRNDPEKIREFFKEIGVVNLPVYYDTRQKYAASVGAAAIPQTIVLNAKGEEIARVIGEANYLDDDLRAKLDELLQAQPTPSS